MNIARWQKLKKLLIIAVGVSLVVTFTLLALRENINVFYSPSELLALKEAPVKTIRLGGMVEKGSVNRSKKDLKVEFYLTDFNQHVVVFYQGILPDLFREGQGVVVLGKLKPNQQFIADEVLAKHDENYMPPEVKASLKAKREPKNVS